ncbi:ATP-dependent Clp protease adaptor ClpS [Neolewinella aurantiaca]|jgi:ATP-dependent Clp protease adaptor protein ClpS|uniref:ATP-dependent Clp protease adaptor ClpS n=1 Tax=Neolewinella aurantiaca TaxID=2602767 RepID=A0A5C7FS09_9BACT|nr:ATP-dependent Clp protease adaptor ClpS [Neolewinella aurantiaca]TXF89173.1 ATP-dependent Clp protease adaptor ClpS [Neolewinella aurantiaca]
MLYAHAPQEDVLLEEEIEVGSGEPADLIVYNDDHNTFDWVMKSFEEILGHSSQQSEQLAMLIHFKGKATVKSAAMAELRPKREALVDRGLSAVIEGR